MDDHSGAERGFAAVATLLVILGLAANEWVLARFSPDGELQAATRTAIRVLQGLSIAAGGAVWLLRRPLAGIFADADRALIRILVAGVLVRVVVHPFLRPHNNDPHWEMILYVLEHGWVPPADRLTLGHQPPLYYLLAAPLGLAGAKAAQLLSLLASVANLVVVYLVVRTSRLFDGPRARCQAFLLAALLPQLVLYGSFVSNDGLAFLVGSLVLAQMLRHVERPTRGSLVLLAAALGVGLLTKGTFLAFLPAVGLVVLLVELRLRAAWRERLVPVALFALVTAVVGGYKYAENAVHFGTPVVGNDVLHQEWVERQQGTVQGIGSFVDVNVAKLVRHPYRSEHTQHSIPLLLYATFWYAYIESVHPPNFDATRRWPFTVVPRALYAAGLLPTLLILVGLGAWIVRHRAPWRLLSAPEPEFVRGTQELGLVLALILNVALVLTWGLRHDAWSFFQSRLAFPALLGTVLLLGRGYETASRGRPALGHALNLVLLVPWGIALFWLAVEIACEAGA